MSPLVGPSFVAVVGSSSVRPGAAGTPEVAVTVVRASKYATTTRLAESAQMTAPSARWSVWVHAARPVRTWRPPTIAWTVNRIAVVSARRMTHGCERCVRQAASAVAHTMTPTTAATHRCRTWALLASVSGGSSAPFISGQSGNTYHCEVAVTCEPNRRSA